MTKENGRFRHHVSALGETRLIDPSTNEEAHCRKVQPFQATKSYLCPGCEQDIPAGTGHYVVVPDFDPGWRRHWHETCLRRSLEGSPKGSNRSKGRRKKKR